MNISVELTLTPLQDDFEPAIIHFIKKMRASGLTVLENPLSTQVYGDYDKVMKVITTEVKEAFEKVDVIFTPTTPTPAFKIGGKIILECKSQVGFS